MDLVTYWETAGAKWNLCNYEHILPAFDSLTVSFVPEVQGNSQSGLRTMIKLAPSTFVTADS